VSPVNVRAIWHPGSQPRSFHLGLHQQDLIERIGARDRLGQRRRRVRGAERQEVDVLSGQNAHRLGRIEWPFAVARGMQCVPALPAAATGAGIQIAAAARGASDDPGLAFRRPVANPRQACKRGVCAGTSFLSMLSGMLHMKSLLKSASFILVFGAFSGS